MKRLFFIILVLTSCLGNTQVPLEKVTDQQWQQDLDVLVSKVERKFAGFKPDTRDLFLKEAQNIREAFLSQSIDSRIMEMTRLLAVLQDGHTEIGLGEVDHFKTYPVLYSYFDSDLRIIAIQKENSAVVGYRVVKIGDTPVQEVLEKLKPFINAENEVEYLVTAPTFMTRPHVLEAAGVQNNHLITLLDERGNQRQISITALSKEQYSTVEFARAYTEPPLYAKYLSKHYWKEYLTNEKIMYVNFTRLLDEDGGPAIKRFSNEVWEEIDQVKPTKLVIDLRLCRGGNYKKVIPIWVEQIKKRPFINQQNKLFIICGRTTFSAGAVAMLHLKDETNSLTVGEVCRARPNWAENVESYTLPNTNIPYTITEELKVHSAKLGQALFIPVDINIDRSFEQYRSGGDEIMNSIIKMK